MPNRHVVSVRTIAEYACAHGSIRAGAFLRSRLKEGTEGHRRIQAQRPEGWDAETGVSYDCEADGILMRIRGRADLVEVTDRYVCVAEIKTTRTDPNEILKDDYPEHWAQAEIYTYILCREHGTYEGIADLVYAGPDDKINRFRKRYTIDELEERFIGYIRPYAEFLKAGEKWAETAAPTFANLKFPFDTYREGQVDMADAVYAAMDRGRVIIEAPTGIGKTAASLFGAIRALGEGKITRVFYLTARTTGRRAAVQALERMRSTGLRIRSVEVTAKEKVCFMRKPDCGMCRYADGYYTRCREAVKAAMTAERLDTDRILDMARDHELCPFELSLDLTMIADVVICDYNYVFDPKVRLKRHFERKSTAGILVDEAHNLIDRSREMYSAFLSGTKIRELRKRFRMTGGEGSYVDEAMTLLIESLTIHEAEFDARMDVPANIVHAALKFREVCEASRINDDDITELMLDCTWFARVAKMFDERYYRAIILPEKEDDLISIKLWCFAPETKLDKLYDHVGGIAMFSATLAPMSYYAKTLAVPNPSDQLELESPFPVENLFTAFLPVSVKFKDRSDTLEKVTRVLHCMTETRKGNYIACFPSHVYMSQVFKYYRMRYPDEICICQKASMNESERMRFIDAFKEQSEGSLLAFIVLGGVFSEGIDLPGDLLSGAAILSTGIPLPNPESELLCTIDEDDPEEAHDAAYTYPGFRKVLQAAGRVIRTENDRGVVLLLDDRYAAPKYQELFPAHWRVRKITGMRQLRESLERFWNEDTRCH